MKREDFYTLPALVQEYLNYMSAVKNYSALTISEYAGDLSLLFRYLAIYKKLSDKSYDEISEVDISNLDKAFISSVKIGDVFAFLDYCRDKRSNDSAARARKCVCMKRFYRYLESQQLIKDNPLKNLDSPKIKKSLPKFLTLEESLALLGSIDGKNKERDYCIITLFLNCGLRLSELVNLNYTDIKSDNTVRIIGKGNKERLLYLNNSCVSAINRYLAVRPHDGIEAKDKNALFISRNKRRISKSAVQNIVYGFLEKAGLGDEGYSVHKLRHTAATLMYQHGNADILLIKEILGHENLSTTQIYTHVDANRVKDAIDSNPLSKVLSPTADSDNSKTKKD